MLERRAESTAKAIAAAARQEGSVRSRCAGGSYRPRSPRATVTVRQTKSRPGSARLKTENKRLRGDVAMLRVRRPSSYGNSTPATVIMGFIDQTRAEGRRVESISRVPREQGVTIAARTYGGPDDGAASPCGP